MDGDFEIGEGPDGPARCPDNCPNAGAPYCPAHEDPAIYRRDATSLHLVEAYANNAARDMIYKAVERQRERRRLKEVRVPSRVMDEWVVFTKKVVLDSGEYTAQGEIERRIAVWLDRVREQDFEQLDRIKERYMRFTSDWRGEGPAPQAKDGKDAGSGQRSEKPIRAGVKRPVKPKHGYAEPEVEYFDEEM
jgi:hypothetical protein